MSKAAKSLEEQTQVEVNGVPVGTLKDVNDRIDRFVAEADKILPSGKAKKGAIPVELVGGKAYKAYEKEVGKDVAKELLEKTNDELKMVLAENILRRDDLKSKLAENKEYIKAKDVVDTLEGGLKSTMKGSDAAAKLAKAVLNSRK